MAGMFILTRMVLRDGMNHFVFVAYRKVIGTLAIAPFAYLLEKWAINSSLSLDVKIWNFIYISIYCIERVIWFSLRFSIAGRNVRRWHGLSYFKFSSLELGKHFLHVLPLAFVCSLILLNKLCNTYLTRNIFYWCLVTESRLLRISTVQYYTTLLLRFVQQHLT